MFVLTENKVKDKPIAAPYTLSGYGDQELENITRSLVLKYPPELFSLELVMYARFKPDFRELTTHDIMFGARDADGATLHTVFQSQQIHKRKAIIKQKKTYPSLNTWVPRKATKKKIPFTPMVDTYLNTIPLIYALVANFIHLETENAE